MFFLWYSHLFPFVLGDKGEVKRKGSNDAHVRIKK